MLEHQEKRILPYHAEYLYKIILDVAEYQNFLPWCKKSRIIKNRSAHHQGIMIAELLVGYKAINEKFTSEIHYDDKKLHIMTYGIKGALKNMQSSWFFEEKGEDCIVHFSVSLSFHSSMLEKIFTSLFENAIARMANSFEQHAIQKWESSH